MAIDPRRQRAVHSAQPPDGLAIPGWLAAVGMGVALFGLALAGPQLSVAQAEESGTSEPAPWAVRATGQSDPHREAVATNISSGFAQVTKLVDLLPVPGDVKWHLQGAVNGVRRTLFNQAPTVRTTELRGEGSTPMHGRIDAVDPDGDPITYRVLNGPASGSVVVDPDGWYTYTPGSGFTGVATFNLAVADRGLHVNLLDPSRRRATTAGTLVNQGAIAFDFTYLRLDDQEDYWTPERRAALHRAAGRLSSNFMVTAPVRLTYEIFGFEDEGLDLAAGAASKAIQSPKVFSSTVVQNKILTGNDANGAEVDGRINVNWAKPWDLGDIVDDSRADFQSVIMHELVHSFGFESAVHDDPRNLETARFMFDSFIVDSSGRRVLGRDGVWPKAYDPNLTGGNGGLYFGGPNAVAAYGKPVPLFAPNPWTDGSSILHLDDATFTGHQRQLMNAYTMKGPGIRRLSPVELAIMKDLGYDVVMSDS